MNPIHITIVIPVYNAEAYLADCLDSLLAQTYSDWEALCVDDGSTDRSAEILQRYSTRNARIKLLTQQNGGAASARNLALRHIKSDSNTWISFVDADDYVRPAMYTDIVEALNQTPSDVDYVRLHCETTTARPTDIMEMRPPHHQDADIQIFDSTGGYFMSGEVGGYTHSLFVRSTVVKENNIQFPGDMRVLEDQVFSFRCAMHSRKILTFRRQNYLYWQNPTSLTSISSPNGCDDIIRCVNYAYQTICNSGDDRIDRYFHEKYMPVKTTALLSLLMRQRATVKFHSDLQLRKYVHSISGIIKYAIITLLRRNP